MQKEPVLTITYLYNSGFYIEGNKFKMIIDYYSKGNYNIFDKINDDGRFLYVLSSHNHKDHFDKEILRFSNETNKILYIFSKDIKNNIDFNGNAMYIDKGDIYQDQLVWVKAFGSTDIGVSFLIRVEGKTLFHAGDLNNWHWNEEVTKEDAEIAQNSFLLELDEIANFQNSIDVAMFPVDPRLGADYELGAKQFVDKVKTKLFIPMHFGVDYNKANHFGAYAAEQGCTFASIKAVGDTICVFD